MSKDNKKVTNINANKENEEGKEVEYKPTQDMMSKDDISEYLLYLLTRNIKGEEHTNRIRNLSRRTVNLGDVSVVVQTLMKEKSQSIEQITRIIQVQEKVLEKLGATDDMFKEAEDEYYADFEKFKEEYEKQVKEAQEKQKEESEDKEEEGEEERFGEKKSK